MIEQGVDIIDIGACSSKPGSVPIEENKEMITKELPKLCVNLSDNLYEKIMGEKKKGSVSDFKKLIGDDK